MEHFEIFFIDRHFDKPTGWYWKEKDRQDGEWYKPPMTDPMGPFKTKDDALANAENWLDH